MALVPTSGPMDSWRAYADRQTPRILGGDYEAYVRLREVPVMPSIQTAVIWRAPIRVYDNPEFWMAPELARQDNVSALGAPPIPYAGPGYVTYQAQPVHGNSSYEDLIGAYAPRPSAGLFG